MQFFFIVSISLIFLLFTLDIEFFYLTAPLVIFHVSKGVGAIIKDYIYFKIINIFFLFCVRVSVLEVLRYLIDFLL